MMRLKHTNLWQLELSTDELRVILKALGGRLREEDYEFAEHLGKSIQRDRAHATKLAHEHADQLLANMDRDDNDGEPK